MRFNHWFRDWLVFKPKLKPSHRGQRVTNIRVYIGGFVDTGAWQVERCVAAPGGAGQAWRQVAGKLSLLPRRWAASKGLHLLCINVIWARRREGEKEGQERSRKRQARGGRARERERESKRARERDRQTERQRERGLSVLRKEAHKMTKCCLHLRPTPQLVKKKKYIVERKPCRNNVRRTTFGRQVQQCILGDGQLQGMEGAMLIPGAFKN